MKNNAHDATQNFFFVHRFVIFICSAEKAISWKCTDFYDSIHYNYRFFMSAFLFSSNDHNLISVLHFHLAISFRMFDINVNSWNEIFRAEEMFHFSKQMMQFVLINWNTHKIFSIFGNLIISLAKIIDWIPIFQVIFVAPPFLKMFRWNVKNHTFRYILKQYKTVDLS